MNYILQRYSDDGQSSLGLLFDDSRKLKAYTLEDERRDEKVKGETRIPAGTYELRLLKSVTPMTERYRAKFPWFSYHVEVSKVIGFSNVYIHVGNKDKDTDGCILLGDSANNNIHTDGFISGSADAYKRWYQTIVPYLETHKAFITIRDEEYITGAT